MADGSGHITWIAADWGTSNLRVWLMGPGPKPLVSLEAHTGAGSLTRDGFEGALLDLVGPYLPESGHIPVMVCGMAGSRQGWAEAAYHTVPCKPPGFDDAVPVDCTDPRLQVRILPGVKQTKPADVMRGEETQIAGFLSENNKFDGVLCLPGTHTKWVHISAEEIVTFQTFMTGEMFALLSEKSMLRHSVAKGGHDAGAFAEGLSDAMRRPQAVAAQLFNIRAATLVADMAPGAARGRLSGLLIGLELMATRPYWLGQNVVLIGADALSEIYREALSSQGVVAQMADANTCVLNGLRAAYETMQETTA
ncbi:2-keto-3-deoxy-galactonokinase [Actibacterium mucosum KCTC 23349]|uniref:2-keto-3-deoxy-galactonokinase n=1 Tax=Actibacterium mucosum KCTC 23349 TaxID=1454373 RepID=A0A037ZKJ4_9RHOB|nr:2-dehydro-3-deoxygalactonokinase [Actibacterium mucosum]KAJ55336.1 2-keto-3-deoxy-galactonokinase [Actibacterium mucosum KCTC 23349]